MIEATFSVSEEEYIDMQKAHWRLSRRKRIQQRIWLGLLSCGSIYCIFELWQIANVQDHLLLFLVGIYPALIILAGSAYAPIAANKTIHKSFAKAAPQLSDIHVQIDDDGYRHDVPGKTNGVLYWPTFTSWFESPQVIVLLRGELMYPIPKSRLNEVQINELRELCSHHLVKT